MNYKDYINIPMKKNDARAKTIGEYLEKLLLTLWYEKDEFSGKRPFGNSCWEYEIYAALISAGVVEGKLAEEGYVEEVDIPSANRVVRELIFDAFAALKGGNV